MSSSLIVVLLKWSDRDSISGTYHLARLVDPMVYRRRGHFSEIDSAAATPKSRANRRAGLIGGYGRSCSVNLVGTTPTCVSGFDTVPAPVAGALHSISYGSAARCYPFRRRDL